NIGSKNIKNKIQHYHFSLQFYLYKSGNNFLILLVLHVTYDEHNLKSTMVYIKNITKVLRLRMI
ncbi:hypothetical protein GIB67_011417, partial [Kingdonia uniflora]